MEYDYDLIEMAEGYDDIDVKETVEKVIKVCNETLEEFGLQSDQNYDSGLEYFDSVEIQDQHRCIIINLCSSIHELFDTDEDCEAIWNASQMSEESIRQTVIEKTVNTINENLNSAAMNSILDFMKEDYGEEDSLDGIEKIILAKKSLAEFAKQHS